MMNTICRLVSMRTAWETLPAILKERVRSSYDSRGEDLNDFLDKGAFILDGDVNSDIQQLSILVKDAQMEDEYIDYVIVINGSLTLKDTLHNDDFSLLVYGDCTCSRFFYVPSFDNVLTVTGTITATAFAAIYAPDASAFYPGLEGRVDTPYAFHWFTDWKHTIYNENTALFLYCDSADFEPPDCNEYYFARDEIFVLKDEVVESLPSYSDKGLIWNMGQIAELTSKGISIYRDGYTPACLPFIREGSKLFQDGHRKEAFQKFRKASELAPGYYWAWLDLAYVLEWENAYDEAEKYIEKAVGLFPEKQSAVKNDALQELANIALMRGDAQKAFSIAGQCLVLMESNTMDVKDLADFYRIRGEASLRMNANDDAVLDLAHAVKYYFQSGNSALRSCWMLGLAYYRLGNMEKAQEYQFYASENERYAQDYNVNPEAGFLSFSGEPDLAGWNNLEPEENTSMVMDETYWMDYLLNKVYTGSTGDFFKEFEAIPDEFLTKDFCMTAIEKYPQEGLILIAGLFPPGAFDSELASALIEKDAQHLMYIPASIVTKELVMKTNSLPDAGLIPESVFDEELADHLVEIGMNPDSLPEEYRTYERWLYAAQVSPELISEAPEEWQDDTLWLTAIAHATNAEFIKNEVPFRYKTCKMLCLALDRNFINLISVIPGIYMDRLVYEYAKSLCPDSGFWDYICMESGKDFRIYRSMKEHSDMTILERYQCFCDEPEEYERLLQAAQKGTVYTSCDSDCWQVFWDEELILREIDAGWNHLSPADIPPELYTSAIADAAFKREPSRITSIPKTFITEDMAETYASRYGEFLYNIPVELRSRNVCELAGSHSAANGNYFPYVPLKYRTAEASLKALTMAQAKPENADMIPILLRHEVFDKLSKQQNNYTRSWVLAHRGLGAFALGHTDMALSDFDEAVSVAKKKKDRELAMFYMAYILKKTQREYEAKVLLSSLSEELRCTFDLFEITEPHEVKDFDTKKCRALLAATSHAIEEQGALNSALAGAKEALSMLEESQFYDNELWAFALDLMRYLTWESDMMDENKIICQKILIHFAEWHDWAHEPADSVIRHTRRAAWHRLAWDVFDDETADFPAIVRGITWAALAVRKRAGEDDNLFLNHYQTLAGLLLRASDWQPSYRTQALEIIKIMSDKDLASHGMVTDERVASEIMTLTVKDRFRNTKE